MHEDDEDNEPRAVLIEMVRARRPSPGRRNVDRIRGQFIGLAIAIEQLLNLILAARWSPRSDPVVFERTVLQHLSLRQKMDALIGIVPDEGREVGLRETLSKLNRRRNLFAHWHLIHDVDAEPPFVFQAPATQSKQVIVEVGHDEMTTWFHEAASLWKSLFDGIAKGAGLGETNGLALDDPLLPDSDFRPIV